MKTMYTIEVSGLEQFVDRAGSALAVARGLSKPLQRLAANALGVLLDGADVTCGETQIQDRLAAAGWPKSWRSTTYVRGIVPGRGTLNAEIVVRSDLFDSGADFWRATLTFPHLPLLVDPDAELVIELESPKAGRGCSMTACSIDEQLLPALIATFGDVFGGESRVTASEACDWRPPPDQPTLRYEIEVPHFREPYRNDDPLAELDALKRPAQRIATALLGVTVPGVRFEMRPFERCRKSVGDDAMVVLETTITTPVGQPGVTINLEYCSIMHPNLSFEIALDDYPRQWPSRGVFSVRYDSRDAEIAGGREHLTVLQAQSFPPAWKGQLVAAIGHALDRRCRIVDEQLLMHRARLTAAERSDTDRRHDREV
ncbi:MAG: hypothetical protein KC609_19190 [Myxococcales bacterium]|nr:hypothetical protein [Myxococcales bacterium]